MAVRYGHFVTDYRYVWGTADYRHILINGRVWPCGVHGIPDTDLGTAHITYPSPSRWRHWRYAWRDLLDLIR